MIPVFLWVFGFIGITGLTFIATIEPYDSSRVKWTLLPLALIFFPFILREGTIETTKDISIIEVSTTGVPFIVFEEDGNSRIVSLSREFGRNIPAGTKVEVYTKIGKYVRFFRGEESADLYRIVEEEQK